MKKQRLPVGAAVLAAAAFLAACGHQLVADPMAPVRAWIGGPPASVSVSKGTVTMIVRPKVANQGFKTQALVPPYVVEDITRLRIELWRVPNPDGTPPDTLPETKEAEVDLSQAQVQAHSPVTFSNLKANKRYEVRCTAFGVDGAVEQQISDEFGSYTTVDVGTDTVVDVTIRVKLGDSDFIGAGSSSVVIVPGEYSATGDPTITVATPAPTPEPTLPPMVASFAGTSFTGVATILSVAGAQVGSNYQLSLDAQPIPESPGQFTYTATWGEVGNLGGPVAVGNSMGWPPANTTLSAPGGAGTLTVQWQGPMAPAASLSETVIISQPAP